MSLGVVLLSTHENKYRFSWICSLRACFRGYAIVTYQPINNFIQMGTHYSISEIQKMVRMVNRSDRFEITLLLGARYFSLIDPQARRTAVAVEIPSWMMLLRLFDPQNLISGHVPEHLRCTGRPVNLNLLHRLCRTPTQNELGQHWMNHNPQPSSHG